MPIIDRRELAFDLEALTTAVNTMHGAAESFGLPGLPLRSAALFPADDQVAFIYGTPAQPITVRLGSCSVGALLISYCVRARIPMPKTAEKGVRIEAEAVVLTVRIEVTKMPPPAGAPLLIKSSAPPRRVGARMAWS